MIEYESRKVSVNQKVQILCNLYEILFALRSSFNQCRREETSILLLRLRRWLGYETFKYRLRRAHFSSPKFLSRLYALFYIHAENSGAWNIKGNISFLSTQEYSSHKFNDVYICFLFTLQSYTFLWGELHNYFRWFGMCKLRLCLFIWEETNKKEGKRWLREDNTEA